MAERTAVRLRVHGGVQGVGYRDWALGRARALGLDGFVRNRLDGTVEILAVGAPAAVEALRTACGEGPPAARVTEVEADPADGIVPTGFTRKPTV